MKIYPGAPHGLTQITTDKDEFSTDLLNLLKVLKRYRVSGTLADHSSGRVPRRRAPDRSARRLVQNVNHGPFGSWLTARERSPIISLGQQGSRPTGDQPSQSR